MSYIDIWDGVRQDLNLNKAMFHIETIHNARMCPECGHFLPLGDFSEFSNSCNDCDKEWLDGLLPKDTETPKGKALVRFLARVRHPLRYTCVVSGCKKVGERHHPDYNKATDIVWLCSEHHRELHRRLKHFEVRRS